jgi:anti-sigma B factor antagonist
MEINLKEQANAVVMKLSGELDFNSYKTFNVSVTKLIENKTPRIVLEMGQVTHIDSMGLGAITKLWKTADQLGLVLALAVVPKNIRNMIKLVNLDKRIVIFDTLEEALA